MDIVSAFWFYIFYVGNWKGMNTLKLRINLLTVNRLDRLYAFNSRIYPDKVIPAKSYIDFFLSKREMEAKASIVLENQQEEIVGQIMASSMSYFLDGGKVDSVWLYDLIVDEQLRKSAWGIDLLLYCMEQHPNSCSTGSGPTALPLHLKLGNKMLGEIRKYVKIVNPLYGFTSFRRGIVPIDKFPKEHDSYRKIGKDELHDLPKPFNQSLFEITRDRAFLQWRYFSPLHSYAFYQDAQSDNYFVLRTTVMHCITVMLLVDYRCNADDGIAFENMLAAVIRITKQLHLPIIVCGSTLAVFDQVLEKHHFHPFGRPRPVIGFVKCKDRKQDIADRKFCFVTLADSDGETNWI